MPGLDTWMPGRMTDLVMLHAVALLWLCES